MRLLLDEMHSPAVAVQLRARGYDALAVKESPELVGLSDGELLLAAAADGRAIVTENIKDFAVLDRGLVASGKHHAGIVFTHPRRFRRGAPDYVGGLADALSRLVDQQADTTSGFHAIVWWLEVDRT